MTKQTFSATIKDGKIEFQDKTGSVIWLELLDGKDVEITIAKEENKRTTRQNNALHKYFELLAEALNDAGMDMREVLKPSIDIEWTTNNVKEYLWRPIQMALLKKESTADLNTTDLDKVYETLTRHLGEKFGIYVEFPNEPNPVYL
jgi:methyltransferase-like protein